MELNIPPRACIRDGWRFVDQTGLPSGHSCLSEKSNIKLGSTLRTFYSDQACQNNPLLDEFRVDLMCRVTKNGQLAQNMSKILIILRLSLAFQAEEK